MQKLIQENGQPLFGVMDTPVGEINYPDYDLRTPMDKKLGRLRKQMGFNQFQFIGVMNEQLIAGLAIVDLKWLSNAFLYVYDCESGELYEKSLISPLALGTQMGIRPDHGVARFKSPGVEVRFDARGNMREVRAMVGKDCEFDLTLREHEAFDPLRVCSRAGYAGWVFTQKAAGLSVTGKIRCKQREYRLLPESSFGSYDWSAGFMRRETCWNWACLSGTATTGEVVGLNLASGVNETGVTENVLWIGQVKTKLDLAVFTFDRYAPEKCWNIRTSDGLVNLLFEPKGKREEKLNAGLLASNFRQMFGYYSGTLTDHAGKVVTLKSVPGFAEDHYAKW